MAGDAKIHDVAVVGAGPAGCMAAIRAGQAGQSVILLERNESIGQKLLLTSNGRCNFTNTTLPETFLNKFAPNPEFYRTAFFKFSNDNLCDFFRAKGLKSKVENEGRILPVTDKATSVNVVLSDYLRQYGVSVAFSRRVIDIARCASYFLLTCQNKECFSARKVIIATGGVTYQATGSTGDGLTMAKRLGHTVTALNPGLVPLNVRERFVKKLQGLSFDDVRITFPRGKKKKTSCEGEIIFTHFGISGPLVLDISSDIVSMLGGKEIPIEVDFFPSEEKEKLEEIFLRKVRTCGRVQVKSFLKELLPQRMASDFLLLLHIPPERTISQISRTERLAIIEGLKGFVLTVTGSLPLDEAMVTCGGIPTKEINPRTMESKCIPGLYFAGEVIESSGKSGGYNLQQAFSTGYLAGSMHCERKIAGRK